MSDEEYCEDCGHSLAMHLAGGCVVAIPPEKTNGIPDLICGCQAYEAEPCQEELKRADENGVLRWKEKLDAQHLMASLPDGCACDLCALARAAFSPQPSVITARNIAAARLDEARTKIFVSVRGTPVPQGTLRSFFNFKTNAPIIMSDNKKTMPWRQMVAAATRREMLSKNIAMFSKETVLISCIFRFPPPKDWEGVSQRKATRPDVDKLLRAILDALTGVVYRDDAQVFFMQGSKLYDSVPGAEISIEVM